MQICGWIKLLILARRIERFTRYRCKCERLILPYEIALQLGAVWEEQTVPIKLSGNLAQMEAWGLVLSAKVAEFTYVLLAFAWTKSTEAPLILGHMNFFAEFDVCFYRADFAFEITSRKKLSDSLECIKL